MDTRARNKRITIQHLTEGQDEIGQPTQVWATLATVYANIRYLSGVESMKAGAQSATAKASIRIRYRSDLTTAMRVVFGSATFQITAILPDETRREHVDLTVEAIQ